MMGSDELSHMWMIGQEANTRLLGFTSYVPFLFRLAAFLVAVPFAVFILLDAISYGIARTLHLSMSQRRVPASPLKDEPRPLETDRDSDTDSDDQFGTGGSCAPKQRPQIRVQRGSEPDANTVTSHDAHELSLFGNTPPPPQRLLTSTSDKPDNTSRQGQDSAAPFKEEDT